MATGECDPVPITPCSPYAPSAVPLSITDDLLQRLDESLSPDSIYSKEIPLPEPYVPSAELLSITDELLNDLGRERNDEIVVEPDTAQGTNEDAVLLLNPEDVGTSASREEEDQPKSGHGQAVGTPLGL